MLLQELLAYHGTSKQHSSELKAPIFLATAQDDAKWFATNRSDDARGVIYKGEVSGRLWDFTKKNVNVTDILDELKIEYDDDPYFFCAEIDKHSPYDGTNDNDIFYIPRVQQYVKSKGYDGVKVIDVLENTSIKVIILLDASRFKIQKIITPRKSEY